MRLILLTVLGASTLVVGMILLPPRAEAPRRGSWLVAPSPPEVALLDNRLRVKNQMARRIVVDRTPLLEAAEWFRQVNDEDGIEGLIRTTPGRSVREKLCRQVIRFVVTAEEEMGQEGYSLSASSASAELSAELDRLLVAGALPPEPGMQ